MAVNMTQASTSTTYATHAWKAVPTVYSNVIDWAEAAVVKGSALANADVIEALRIPAGSIIMQAGLKTIVAPTGASSDVTVDLGVTGGDVDQWVDGYDLDAGTAGQIATPVAAGTTDPMLYLASSDTIDILFVTATTPPTAGKVQVSALVLNLFATEEVGLAQVGA